MEYYRKEFTYAIPRVWHWSHDDSFGERIFGVIILGLAQYQSEQCVPTGFWFLYGIYTMALLLWSGHQGFVNNLHVPGQATVSLAGSLLQDSTTNIWSTTLNADTTIE